MSISAPSISLRERRRAETAAEIVHAARALFADRGYQETRTSDIASRAGVSDATLFRYFASKSDIALAGVAERVDFALERLAAQPTDLGELEAAQLVLSEVLDLSLFGPDDPAVAEIALVGVAPELLPALDSKINAAAEATAQVLASRSGRPRPTLRDRVHAHQIASAVQAAAETWFEDRSGPPFTALLAEAFAVLATPHD